MNVLRRHGFELDGTRFPSPPREAKLRQVGEDGRAPGRTGEGERRNSVAKAFSSDADFVGATFSHKGRRKIGARAMSA
ncbi:MAG: hypothetical protein ABWY14_13555 [Tardiphaga sp.]